MAPALTERAASGPADLRWRDLRIRALSAAVLAPVALACIWASPWSALALMLAGGAALAWEWAALWRGRLVAALAAGLPYIGIPLLSLAWLRFDPLAGRANLIFLIAAVWATDIAAYVAGRLLGGPRLAPRISPGKTWSGAAGGLTGAVLVGLAAFAIRPAPAGIGGAAAVAAGLSVVSQAGDLFESWLKRRFGVKDSGRMIPGHGGLLDRVDGLLAAAPAAALLALLLGRGVVIWG